MQILARFATAGTSESHPGHSAAQHKAWRFPILQQNQLYMLRNRALQGKLNLFHELWTAGVPCKHITWLSSSKFGHSTYTRLGTQSNLAFQQALKWPPLVKQATDTPKIATSAFYISTPLKKNYFLSISFGGCLWLATFSHPHDNWVFKNCQNPGLAARFAPRRGLFEHSLPAAEVLHKLHKP